MPGCFYFFALKVISLVQAREPGLFDSGLEAKVWRFRNVLVFRLESIHGADSNLVTITIRDFFSGYFYSGKAEGFGKGSCYKVTFLIRRIYGSIICQHSYATITSEVCGLVRF